MTRQSAGFDALQAMTRSPMSRRRFGAVAGASAASLLVPIRSGLARPSRQASTPSAAGGEPVYGGTLIYARNIDSQTLDPHFSTALADRFTLYCVFNTLVAWDTNFNVVPELAKSWDIDEKAPSITFHLQPGVMFHDGTPCDAAAIKWNIERVLNPDVGSTQRGQLEPAIASVDVVDPVTVRMNLKKPWRPLLAALGERPGFVVSPTAVQKLGADAFGRNPVGTGPFKFVEWAPDSHIKMEKFDGYWDKGKPYLDGITIQHVPDSQVQSTMVRTGEAHLVDEVDPSIVPTLKSAPDVKVVEYESGHWYGTQCDVDKPPFNNADLRKALAHATDREAIKQLVFGGTGRVMPHPVANGWAFDPSLNDLMPFDLDMAKQFLDKSGAAGQTFTFTASNARIEQDLAQAYQAQYQQLGINVQIQTVDAAQSFALVKNDTTNWTTTDWTPRA
ncbi:MAG TPA: ABC transporter substrate-binding protein, partial [Thermomicrobiales bacterium]|nr:ABC transporter substrate-binding protein [Thermomicrobiales bacterium]